MPVRLIDMFPDAETLLSLEPEELGGLYLQYLRALPERSRSDLNRYNFTLEHNFHDYAPEHRDPIARAITEAWAWLEREGFLAPQPAKTGEWSFITRRGMAVESADDLTRFRRAQVLPRKTLHARLASKVWPQFLRGEYDVAVFQAFKEVEVAVRDAGGFANTDLGVSLMRAAFHPDSGPLSDKGVPRAEREARSALFAGAIGSYKNPHSHRDVAVGDAVEAVELLFLAGHLLRLVERAQARGPGEAAT